MPGMPLNYTVNSGLNHPSAEILFFNQRFRNSTRMFSFANEHNDGASVDISLSSKIPPCPPGSYFIQLVDSRDGNLLCESEPIIVLASDNIVPSPFLEPSRSQTSASTQSPSITWISGFIFPSISTSRSISIQPAPTPSVPPFVVASPFQIEHTTITTSTIIVPKYLPITTASPVSSMPTATLPLDINHARPQLAVNVIIAVVVVGVVVLVLIPVIAIIRYKNNLLEDAKIHPSVREEVSVRPETVHPYNLQDNLSNERGSVNLKTRNQSSPPPVVMSAASILKEEIMFIREQVAYLNAVLGHRGHEDAPPEYGDIRRTI